MGKHTKRKNKKMITLAILRLMFFIILIISIIYVVKWYIDSKRNEMLEEKVSEAIIVEDIENNITNEYKIDFEKLKETNNQVVAWLKVKGTSIEYPIVQGKDNSYYLKKNFEKQYNIGGWIFVDYKNKLDETDKNIVVYGHNMKDNSMFGSLKNILKEEWYNNEENYIIDFITEEYTHKYQVFSVYRIKNEDYYIDTEFKNNEFVKFIKTLKNRSIKDFNVEVSKEDRILTLSTCDDNNKYRVVLHAKRISE
ncbi:MAG: class B sortase [Clostridia bacterium]|nr:class B sortase [Clostridia bacterium]